MSLFLRHPALEAGLLFLLLLPFYAGFLRTTGGWHTFGFVYLALLCGYMLFLTPHRLDTPPARKSLREVAILTSLALFFEWGILPQGPTGRVVGQILLGMTAFYILFISARVHGDRWEDWGLGDPRKFFRYLRRGRHRGKALAAIFMANLGTLLACLYAHDLAFDILRSVLRKSFGIRIEPPVSHAVLALGALFLLNLFLAVVIRYDNLRKAGRIVGCYFLGLIAVVAIGGYVYIYLLNGAWVEFQAKKGIVGMGSYILWGTLQELLFLSYYNTRIRKGLSSPLLAALLTAVIFSIYHLNAYTLMFICFLVGIIWALIFQAAPNLFLLGISHGISGGFGSSFKVHGMTLLRIKASVGPFNP